MNDHLANKPDDWLLDNAATASQHRPLVEDAVLREAIVLNIIQPLRQKIADLEALLDTAH